MEQVFVEIERMLFFFKENTVLDIYLRPSQLIFLRQAASSSAFALILQVTPATYPWTPQTSGLHV